MRIGHVSLYYGGGGAGNHVRRVAEAMRHQGHDAFVFTSTSQVDSPQKDWIIPLKVSMTRGFARLWTHQFNKQLEDVLPKYDLDIVHGNPVASDLAKIRDCFSAPYVVTLHGCLRRSMEQLIKFGFDYSRWSIDYLYRLINSRIEKRAYQHADHVFPITKSVVHDYARFYGPRNEITVIPNAVRPGDDSESTTAVNSDQKTLLYVGSFTQRKGLHFLMQAFQYVLAKFPTAELHLVSGNENPYLQSIITDTVQHNIVIHDWIPESELGALYDRADLFVFPSIYEGLGTVLIEAIQHRLPIVAFDVPGVQDVVSDQSIGTTVEVGDAEAMATAILNQLTGKSPPSTPMESSQKERLVDKYSPERIGNEYISVYRKLTG